MLRSGFSISPATIGRFDHPWYAQSAAIIAAPNPLAPAGAIAAVSGWRRCVHEPDFERRNAPNTTIAMPPSLATVAAHCTRPPTATPRELTAQKTRITAT